MTDALNHHGPAAGRVDRHVCGRILRPGVDPLTFATDLARAVAVLSAQLATSRRVPAEPPLKAYTR
ncbi:MAG TPA: hypothetical protein VN088_19905 [Nocardioides sp.]|nr:hypothetical protein [Nocardioides sp.]